jgi:hypothetical protein
LAEFPIALLADRAPKGQKTLHFEGGHGRLTVTGSDEYGLPTPVDADVIVALIYLTKQRTNFRDVKVNFSRYELIKLLKWADEGRNYKRLQLALNRWHGVSLIYDKCWWDNKQKKHVSANMHILESVIYAAPGGDPRDGRGELPLSTFTWNKTFIESCQADNLRQLDLDTYFSLKSAVSKRLYRFLGKRFYMQGEWTFDLNEIAFDRVGLSRGYAGDAGKIKEKLQPAIDELEAIGFLGPLGREDRYRRVDRGRWTIRLGRRSPVLAEPPPSAPPEAEASPPLLAAELVRRGVKPQAAADLAGRHPAAYVAGKIEQFDWEMTQAKPPKKPAGYLVKSIVDGYDADPDFVPKAERDRQADAAKQRRQAEADARRRRREEDAREQAEKKAVDAYWESLTPGQQAELDDTANAGADPEQLAMERSMGVAFQRLGQQLRRGEHIRQLLRDRQRQAAEACPAPLPKPCDSAPQAVRPRSHVPWPAVFDSA